MKAHRGFGFIVILSKTLPLLVFLSGSMRAQSIVAQVPPSEYSPLTGTRLSSDEPAHPAASSVASALSSEAPLFQRGPIAVRPHLVYSALYADGIEAGPGNPRTTYIQSVAPGALFDLGKYWRLDYAPTWTFYSNPLFRNTADQSATLSGRVPYDHGRFGVAQGYDSSYAMLVETGRQTHQKTYSTLVEGTYALGLHTIVETTASRNARYANALTDAPEWTTSNWVQWSSTSWVRYAFSSRLEAAAGVALGYSQIGVGADMSSTQPQAKIVWKPASKLSLTAQAGEEDRRFVTGSHPRLKSPVYTVASIYQLLPTTRLFLDATRSVSASYFANEITKTKGWRLGVEQRFVQKLYLEATLAGQNTDYLSTVTAVPVQRDDRYRVATVRLTTVLLHRISIALLYQKGRNSSDRATYVVMSDQYGIETSLQF